MRNHERSGSSFEEQLRRVQDRYVEDLGQTVAEHSRASSDISAQHSQDVQAWLEQPSDQARFAGMLNKPAKSVDKTVQTTASEIDTTIVLSSRMFANLIPDTDRQVWQRVQESAGVYGVDSSIVDRTLSAASSNSSRAAMKAALDRQVWQRVQESAGVYGVDSSIVDRTLSAASSNSSRAAMKAALDRQVWQRVQESAGVYGVDSSIVDRTLSAASSNSSRAAMKAALDRQVWQRVQSDVQTYGVTSTVVDKTLRGASSPASRDAMKNQLPKPQPRQTFNEDHTYVRPEPPKAKGNRFRGFFRRSTEDDTGDASNSGPFEGVPNFDEFLKNSQKERDEMLKRMQEERDKMFKDVFGDMFSGAGGFYSEGTGQTRSNQAPPPPPPRAEAPPRPKPDTELRDIIQKAINEDRDASWLSRADPKEVRRVIATVRTLREKAIESDDPISDKQIYLKYRRLVETTPDNERLLKSFKVLAALMGNKPNGTLPF